MTNPGNVNVVRQNFHAESEAAINRQINLELYASYVYFSLFGFFDRDDVALKGFAKFFKKRAVEKRKNEEKLIKYQNLRGGRIVLADVKKPERDEWGTGLEAMQSALQLEKNINQSLLEVYAIASKHDDSHMTYFLEQEFLEEQVRSIKEIGDFCASLKRVGPGLGEFQFDKETFE